MKINTHRTRMLTTRGNKLSRISPARFAGGHQILVVHIAQHAGQAETHGLPDFDEGDVAAAHPDLDCPLGDSEVLRNLPLCHEPVFKRDCIPRRCRAGLSGAIKLLSRLVVPTSCEVMSCKHILVRTAKDCSLRVPDTRKCSRSEPGKILGQPTMRAGAVSPGLLHSATAPHDRKNKPMTNKRILHILPDDPDGSNVTVDQLVDAATGEDGYWPNRVKQAFVKAGFAIHRLEREPHHPVWMIWLNVGRGDLPADKKAATKQLRGALVKAGLQLGPDEITILDRRPRRLKCVFVYASVLPAIDLMGI
jgi:hypothetical protein